MPHRTVNRHGSRFLEGLFRRRCGRLADRHQQAFAQLFVDLVGDGRVVAQELAHVLLALADAVAVVAVPGAGLVDQVFGHAQLDDLTLAGRAFAIQNLELALAERRRHLVLDHLDAGFRTDDLFALLDRADTTDVQPHRGVELQRVAAGGGFRAAEHHADLHADLVDEDHQGAGFLDVRGELAQGLAHQAGVQADVGITHLTLDFRLRGQRGHRVDHHHVVDLDAELFGIGRIERVFGVDEGGGAAGALATGDRLQGHGGLAGRFRPVDLDHATAWQAADTQSDIQPQRAGGDGLDRLVDAIAHAHHGTLAELLLDLAEGGAERLALVVIHRVYSGWAVNGEHDARIESHRLRSHWRGPHLAGARCWSIPHPSSEPDGHRPVIPSGFSAGRRAPPPRFAGVPPRGLRGNGTIAPGRNHPCASSRSTPSRPACLPYRRSARQSR